MSSIQQHLIPDLKVHGATALIECRLAAVLVFLEERPYLARHVVTSWSMSWATAEPLDGGDSDGSRGFKRGRRGC